MENKKITIEQLQIIGVLYASFLNLAITQEELEKAIYSLIEKNSDEELFSILIDLLDYDGSRSGIIKNFRQINHKKWLPPLSGTQYDALVGIAYKRGNWVSDVSDPENNEEHALKALKNHPEVEELFRRVFPFIKL